MVQKSRKGPPSYIINGSSVSYVDFLARLGTIIVAEGHEIPVTVAFEESIPMAELHNTRGIIEKAGFTHVRYYVYGKDHSYAGELKFGLAVPYSDIDGSTK